MTTKFSALDLSHKDWIEGESIRSFMPLQLQSQVIALFVIPAIFGLLYGHAPTTGLVIWALITSAVAIFRWRITKHYLRHLVTANTDSQLQFIRKYAWTWPTAAALWGSMVWLFFSSAPLLNQFIAWSVLASIGVFTMTGYSAHLKIMYQFLNIMVLVMLFSVGLRYFSTDDATIQYMSHWLLPFILLLWALLGITGNRLNAVHLQRLKLIKGNQDLINSLQEQTNRANKAIDTKNRFLASAAHDIRQPVLALDVYASMLKGEPGMVVELTEKIGVATKSVIEMFDSLFDLSRLDAGQLKINKSNIDIAALFQELEIQYKPAAQSKKLELRTRADSVILHTDLQLLKRILGNLLMNAIKFTNKGGILLACRKTRLGFRFEVWDTGVGIDLDQQEAVFGEFYKSPSHQGTSEGFGLGLSIVTRLCNALEFNFSMRSKLGYGSVFWVEIPAINASQFRG